MTRSTFGRLLKQLAFGIDTTSAILWCAGLGLAFGIRPNFMEANLYVTFALICNYLPDLDLLIYLPFHKRWGIRSHWQLGHHPLLVIPAVGITTFQLANVWELQEVAFVTTLAIACVTSHFVHDSVHPCGLHWFSPLHWKHHLVLHGGPIGLVDSSIFWNHESKIQEAANTGTNEFFATIAEPVTTLQRMSSALGTATFVFWIYVY